LTLPPAGSAHSPLQAFSKQRNNTSSSGRLLTDYWDLNMDTSGKTKKPNRVSLLFKRNKQQKASPRDSEQTAVRTDIPVPGDKQRTGRRYLEAAKLLEGAVKGQEGRWKVFDFPELKGEPDEFNDALFKDKLNMAMESKRNAIKNQTAWEKCKHVVQCSCTALSPFAKNFLIIAKEGSSVGTVMTIFLTPFRSLYLILTVSYAVDFFY
jgi:hypothetical protein